MRRSMIKVLSCVTCDDIREEADGRVSLMGVFPHRVHVESVPHTIDRLGVMFKIGFDESALKTGINVAVLIPGGEIIEMPFPRDLGERAIQDAEADGIRQPLVFVFDGRLLATSLSLPEAGCLRVRVVSGEERAEAILVVVTVTPKPESLAPDGRLLS